jgi:hypothetical protein
MGNDFSTSRRGGDSVVRQASCRRLISENLSRLLSAASPKSPSSPPSRRPCSLRSMNIGRARLVRAPRDLSRAENALRRGSALRPLPKRPVGAHDHGVAKGLAGDLDHQVYRFLWPAFWTHLDPSPALRHVIDIDLDARSDHQEESPATNFGLNVKSRAGDHCVSEITLYCPADCVYLHTTGNDPPAAPCVAKVYDPRRGRCLRPQVDFATVQHAGQRDPERL